MERRERTRRNTGSGRAALFVVMIGFCVLALIEIAYGQSQLKMEKERLALEEENHRAIQELKEEWSSLKSTDTSVQESVMEEGQGTVSTQQISSAETSDADAQPKKDGGEESTPEQEAPAESDKDMQIVFLGDSILDNAREYDGVAFLVGEKCNANVYNLSIGGTTAALTQYEQYNFATWNSISMLGILNAILGNINKDVFKDYRAGEIMEECDFSKTDYFVIEYGINDFLAQIPRSRYLEGGVVLAVDEVHTYVGALEIAIMLLQDNFPDAKIILIAPHYCQIFSGSTFIGDGYSVDYGNGTLHEYAQGCGYVYEQHMKEGVLFFNAFESSGIDSYTADTYLEDGIHLSAEGRQLYADIISRLILGDFYPEE